MYFEVAGREIGAGRPLFVIAEIGLNHGGRVETALALVDAAAHAGASAVKLQSFRAEQLVAASCPAPAHVEAHSLVDFFRQFELDEAAHHAVAARARTLGLAFVATPFHESAVAMLEVVGCDAIKIASGDLTHRALIERAARAGRPLIISTGMAELEEVAEALDIAVSAGADEVALLHCVSAYPVPAGQENLAAIATLARTFHVPVGLSDHGSDSMAAALTVALGGAVYERHLRLDGDLDVVDSAVSSTPDELGSIVASAERARLALGDGRKQCLAVEEPNRIPSRRAVHAARALVAGHTLVPEDLVALRPLFGIDARLLASLAGRRLRTGLAAGSPIHADDLDEVSCPD